MVIIAIFSETAQIFFRTFFHCLVGRAKCFRSKRISQGILFTSKLMLCAYILLDPCWILDYQVPNSSLKFKKNYNVLLIKDIKS